MKILRLDIKGFRSLKDVSWEPGDLNVVIGPNGSGKSNLLRMLELISICAKGGLSKHIQSQGGMGALVWDGIADAIEFSINVSPTIVEKSVQPMTLRYHISLKRLGKTSAFQIDDEQLSNRATFVSHKIRAPIKFIARKGSTFSLSTGGGRTPRLKKGSLDEDQPLLSLVSSLVMAKPVQVSRTSRALAGIGVYQDFSVNQNALVRQAAVARVEKRVEPDGQNLTAVLHTLYTGDREFKKNLDLAMRAAFGDDFDELVFPPAADQRVQLRIRWKTLRREQSAADLSDGTLRFLFLLAVLASPEPASVIAIDEPETGLHPSMLPIIAEYAVDASHRAQVILTTHSPQMLDAFGDTKPVITVATWSNGETVLKRLDEDELKRWLKEYSLGSLFRSGELEEME